MSSGPSQTIALQIGTFNALCTLHDVSDEWYQVKPRVISMGTRVQVIKTGGSSDIYRSHCNDGAIEPQITRGAS